MTQINPKSVVVNGIAFPNATLATDPVDENKDGIPDAIVTITPRSALNLANGLITFTISGRTTAAAGNRRFTGSATVNVSGSNGGGGNGGAFIGATPLATPATNFIPPNGSALIPTVASLSQYDSYQPLAQSIAYAQFRPATGWLLRMEIFSGKISQKNPNVQRHGFTLPGHNNSGIHTLNDRVFTRSKYHATKVDRGSPQGPGHPPQPPAERLRLTGPAVGDRPPDPTGPAPSLGAGPSAFSGGHETT